MGKKLKEATFFIFALALALVSFSYTQGRALGEADGNDWLKGPDDLYQKYYRNGYIVGVMAGVYAANIEADKVATAIKLLENERAENKNGKPDLVMDLLKDAQERIEGLKMIGITIGQVTDGMNVFYSEFANRRIKIFDGVFIVKMQIDGRDPDLIQAQIRYLRMPVITQEEYYRISLKKPEDVTEEENLKRGYFIDKSKVFHVLFRYGDYR